MRGEGGPGKVKVLVDSSCNFKPFSQWLTDITGLPFGQPPCCLSMHTQAQIQLKSAMKENHWDASKISLIRIPHSIFSSKLPGLISEVELRYWKSSVVPILLPDFVAITVHMWRSVPLVHVLFPTLHSWQNTAKEKLS